MAVEFINIGNHKNVYSVVFGRNDVLITQCVNVKDMKAMIMFHSSDNGETINPERFGVNRSTDELPCPEVTLVFEEPETIATLIQSLCEIQKLYFK